jgi:predicted PurR-regulated permease PerM
MAFFRAGYRVGYVSIKAGRRQGRSSHINHLRDGVRFLLIIFKIATLYSPSRIFLPVSFGFFVLGVSNYLYTFFTDHRFTNMSALLLITSVLVFLIGLISEQITLLMYSKH